MTAELRVGEKTEENPAGSKFRTEIFVSKQINYLILKGK